MDNQEIIKGQKIMEFSLSEEWGIVKDIFTEKILDLQSIKNIDLETPEAVILDIKARNTAIDILNEVIEQVEGRAEQHKNNDLTENKKEDDLISYS